MSLNRELTWAEVQVYGEVAYEIDAYLGFPDAQESVLSSAVQNAIPKSPDRVDTVPVSWRAAFSEPNGAERLESVLNSSPMNHLKAMVVALEAGVEFDEMAKKMALDGLRIRFEHNKKAQTLLDKATSLL